MRVKEVACWQVFLYPANKPFQWEYVVLPTSLLLWLANNGYVTTPAAIPFSVPVNVVKLKGCVWMSLDGLQETGRLVLDNAVKNIAQLNNLREAAVAFGRATAKISCTERVQPAEPSPSQNVKAPKPRARIALPVPRFSVPPECIAFKSTLELFAQFGQVGQQIANASKHGYKYKKGAKY